MKNDRRNFLHRSLLITAGCLFGVPAGRLFAESSVNHTVRRGETLTSIAAVYGVSIADLRRANALQGDHIRVGQNLVVPASGLGATVTHVIRSGETLSGIAKQYGVRVADIQRANGMTGTRIIAGQTLLIPAASGATASRDYIAEVRRVTSGIRIPRGRWQWIVGHHSGIEQGNAASYDRFHREDRRMENGLAYHFVIGNGIDSGRGQIEIGDRWHRQLQGGHVRNHQVNLAGIGICLVGNFERRAPHPEQLEAFTQLVSYLRNEVLRGQRPKFAVHREIDRGRTVCPGRHFPISAMHRRFPS